MARRKKEYEALPTIWRVSDHLWDIVKPIIEELDPPAKTGRPRIGEREALDGIVHQMRSGAQWSQLPKQFGDDSSVHRTMQRWIAKGVLERLWALLVGNCEELGGVSWGWQSADGAMGKARFGGTTSAPTPRIAASPAPSAAW